MEELEKVLVVMKQEQTQSARWRENTDGRGVNLIQKESGKEKGRKLKTQH